MPGCSTDASPTPRRTSIPSWLIEQSGKPSRRSARSWCRSAAGSTGSTRSRHRSRRPAWCGSTTTSTRSARARSAGRSRSRLMPSILIRQDGAIVGDHARRFGRGETIYDPWHYVPVLARKPGALRNGAPFKDWPLPASLERVRRKLKGSDDGDRQMVKVLSAVLTDGLAAVEAACGEALSDGVHSADIILNILARHRNPAPAATILTPDALRLRHAPIADCARYDRLRRAS